MKISIYTQDLQPSTLAVLAADLSQQIASSEEFLTTGTVLQICLGKLVANAGIDEAMRMLADAGADPEVVTVFLDNTPDVAMATYLAEVES